MFSVCTAAQPEVEAKQPVTVLVLHAGGRQGGAVVEALLAEPSSYEVWGTTRSKTTKEALELKGVKVCLGNACQSKKFIWDSLCTSKATVMFFCTREGHEEFIHGKEALECAVKAKLNHVVYSSVCDAENMGKISAHAWMKKRIEDLMKLDPKFTPRFTILRPVTIVDNIINSGDSKKEPLRSLAQPQTKLKLVTLADIGKAAVGAISNPSVWAGNTVDCVSFVSTGREIAAALGDGRVYQPIRPGFCRCCDTEFKALVKYAESQSCPADLDKFVAIVPKPSTLEEVIKASKK